MNRLTNADHVAGLPRFLDQIAALFALILSSPILLVAAAAVRVSMGTPIFFRQPRVGQGGVPFVMIKFRTMRRVEGALISSAGDPRITAVGRILRKSKVDELPQLWNVVRGDMALVGPRPEVPEFVNSNEPLWAEILSVRPGITDPVSLNLVDEEQYLPPDVAQREAYYRTKVLPFKLRAQAEYLRRRSWTSDLAVLGNSVVTLLRRRRNHAVSPAPWDQKKS